MNPAQNDMDTNSARSLSHLVLMLDYVKALNEKVKSHALLVNELEEKGLDLQAKMRHAERRILHILDKVKQKPRKNAGTGKLV